ncbi:neuronal acetylcholine receptor subunit alpha-2-like [Asterias rubens]|uniref:neuronal acetylcholine receptor subunit alpha-2-like n=1 Tax=Asterias rubens TaxID=7604 RepID=UPI001454EBC4|nr:neuronal acetylcholine receptor subunit alpha-2-like [Asterias rubens]
MASSITDDAEKYMAYSILRLVSFICILENVDEVKQQLAVNVWLRMRWPDEFLTWNPANYNGTAVIRIPANMLWKPDIVLYQSVDPNPLSGDLGLSCVVSSDGIVQFNTPYIFISYCKVDLTYYPFDTQRCPLKFGSWSFDETGVDINASRPVPELDKYQPNGEWDLLDMFVTNHKIKYSCCPHKFPDVEYTLVIERKPEFYVANIILPYVLISILSIFVFYLPPESGEKMNLSITTMLSLIVFNELVITTIPPASDGTFPIMGKYFVVMIAVVAMSVLMSVWVLHLYHKEHNSVPMPPFLRQLIFGWLARAVGKCKYRSHLNKNKVKDKYHGRNGMKRKYRGQDNGLLTKVRCFPHFMTNDSTTSVKESLSEDFTNGSDELILEGTVEMIELGSDAKPSRVTVRLEREVNELARLVDYLAERKRTKDSVEDFAREWRDAAAVVDRALLIIFTLVNISLPLFFLLSATGRFL